MPHSETHGFDDADNSRAAYARCHELLAECCAVITQNGGVARELTPADWALLRDIPMTRAGQPRPFHATEHAWLINGGRLMPPCLWAPQSQPRCRAPAPAEGR